MFNYTINRKQRKDMTNILITGGTGFVGSHLVDELLKNDDKVVVVDDFSNSSEKNLAHISDKIKLIKKDVSESDWSDLFEFNPDVIYHLATHPRSFSIQEPLRNMEVNVKGTLNLLEFAKKKKAKVIYTSNSGIYGNHSIFPVDESFSDNPFTPYDATKLIGEHYGKIYHKIHEVYFVAFRLATVYGERQKINEKLGWYPVIPEFVGKIFNNKIATIHADGNQTRDFVYVKDVVNCLILGSKSTNSGGEVFNLSTNKETSIKAVYDLICNILDKKIESKRGDELPGDIRRMCYSYEKAKKNLGYSPKYSLEDGIKRYVNWYRDNS